MLILACSYGNPKIMNKGGVAVMPPCYNKPSLKKKGWTVKVFLQSAQGGDKSRQTSQILQSRLKHMSFMQGPVEVSTE